MSWVLVTGGAQRLGREICKVLAHRGYDVAIHYKSSGEAASCVASECRAMGVNVELLQGDFSSPASTKEFVERVKQHPLKHLINNVGNYWLESALETSLERWRDLFQTNFFAPLELVKMLVPSLKEQRGSIVNIGVAGIDTLRGHSYSAAYVASKASLLMLTKALAVELAPNEVRVNMVSPGQLDISVDYLQQRLPMGRPGSCREVADVVAFLVDDANGYITGQNIEVAGGVRL